MSMRTMARSSSNRKSASDLASSVLPTPVGPRNRNEPVGRSGSATPARARRTASETAGHGGLLADQSTAELLLHPQELAGLPLEQPPGRDAGPGGDHLGDLVGADLLAHHQVGGHVRLRRLRLLELLLHLRDLAVDEPGGGLVVAVTLGPLGGGAHLVDARLDVAHPVEALLLGLPARLEPAQLLLASASSARSLTSRSWLASSSSLDRCSSSISSRSTERRSSSISTGRSRSPCAAGAGLVDQVDRLVRQLATRYVAVAEGRSRDEAESAMVTL
jgi:hypothetical protein